MNLKFAIMIWVMAWAVAGQSNTCYANCKRGFCLPTNALACTGCDLGLVNVNNMCIGGSSQAAPVTFLKPSYKGLTDSLSPLNCSVTTGSASTQMMFEPTIGSTFTRSFSLPSLHIYLQVKFNAIVATVGQPLASSTLLLTVFTASGQTIYTTVKSFNSSSNPVACSSNYQAYDVFNGNEKFASTDSSVLVEVRASGTSNANVALSDFQLYYGNCSQQCGQCFGPTNQQCLSCRGLLAILVSSQCINCSLGFYQVAPGSICMACPVECATCKLVSGQPQCISCNSDIAFTVDLSVSPLGCKTNYSKLVEASDQSFASSSWLSSETSGSTVTSCGYYSLVGGVSIGVAGSSLRRVFMNLPAHTTLYIYFTLFLIDQAVGDLNGYLTNIDGQVQPVSLSISAPQGATLTNECGTSAFEFAIRQSFQFQHNASSATLTISFLKDYAGIRDIALVANNQTSVANCYSELNSTCTACRNGFALINNTCNSCADGYYLNERECLVCPITCKTCNSVTGKPTCLSCQPPLVLDGNFCIDASQALFATDVVDGIASSKNGWSLYPRLQNNGITSCNGTTILGSSDIKFKFLKMKRTFTGLPAHTGVAISFQFYQIDDYAADESVKFTLNNSTTIYQPSNLKMDLCGNSSPDAIVPVYLTDNSHSAPTLDFQVSIDRMGKLGIRNLMVFLLNTPSSSPPFTLEVVPTYSVSTPPVKGLTVKLLFPQTFTITNGTDSVFQFAIKSSSGRLLQSTSGSVVLAQNSSINGNKQLLYLLDVSRDYSGSQLEARAASPSSLSFTDSNGNIELISQQLVTASVPRYIDMDTGNVADRSSCRNLYNLFRGCAILGLFIGMASFLVGMSAAFDDFLLLCQLIFVHVFIQLEYNPPSVRIPFQGLHIVQFLEWLPWEARQSIQSAILPGDLYQQSPLVYEQYFKDVVFARMAYQPLLFLAAVGVLWVVLHVVLGVWDSKHPSVKYQNYFLYYYNRIDKKQVAFIDKTVRFAYFPIVWACVLQFTHLANDPKSFNIWNSALTIVLFVGLLAYPAVMFYFFWKRSTTISSGTFHKRYEEIRINPEKLYYFLVRYYKLVAIACIVGLLYAASPVIPLIVLIALNLGDALLLIFLDPLGMVQPQLIEATTFYPKYPLIYHMTSVAQQALFIILEILFLVLFGQRNGTSSSSYMGIGYAICVVVILLLLNGLLRLFWGFMKQAQHCYLERETLEQSIEKQVQENKDPAEEHPIMENAYKSQVNISKRDLSRLNSKKMSHVSKIR